jgi:hypothetical protein
MEMTWPGKLGRRASDCDRGFKKAAALPLSYAPNGLQRWRLILTVDSTVDQQTCSVDHANETFQS